MRKISLHIILVTTLFFGLGNSLNAQQFFRISGEMTIKSKKPSGSQALSVGKIYFDRNIRQIIYNISFPQSETWVTTDSMTYRIVNDSILSRHRSIGMAEFSVFNLALNSHLPDYGLKNSSYHVDNVELVNGKVVTTWSPQENMKDKMGNILVSTEDKKLFGVIFFNSEGEVLRKQFFEEYLEISGIAFPGKIVEIGYGPDGESYQISNFRNIKLNELENSSLFSYSLPDNASF